MRTGVCARHTNAQQMRTGDTSRGQHAEAGADVCLPCPANRNPSPDGAACEPCPPGFAPNGLDRTQCTSCIATGRVSTDGTRCEPCDAGFAPPGDGFSPCTPCPEGAISARGDAACKLCAAGAEPASNATRCASCEPGRISAEAGPCLLCEAGKEEIGRIACAECSAGHWSGSGASDCTECVVGKAAGRGQTVCSDCAEGRHAPTNASSACVSCPVNMDSVKGAASCVAKRHFVMGLDLEADAEAAAGTVTLHRCPLGSKCAPREGDDECMQAVDSGAGRIRHGCTQAGLIGARVELLELLPGWWRTMPFTLTLSACMDNPSASLQLAPDESMCQGGVSSDLYGESVCKVGSAGPYCAVCAAGFASQGGECVLCDEVDFTPLGEIVGGALAAVVGGAVVAGLALSWRRQRQASRWRRMLLQLQRKTSTSAETLLSALLEVADTQQHQLGGEAAPAPATGDGEGGRRATIVAIEARRKSVGCQCF